MMELFHRHRTDTSDSSAPPAESDAPDLDATRRRFLQALAVLVVAAVIVVVVLLVSGGGQPSHLKGNGSHRPAPSASNSAPSTQSGGAGSAGTGSGGDTSAQQPAKPAAGSGQNGQNGLSDTGPGDVLLVFAAGSGAGAAGYQVVLRRRLKARR